jgi:hypothetical protein
MSNNNTAGIGFAGLLAILFIGLKLTGYIAWSWWWVFSPLWIQFLFIFSMLTFVTIVGVVLKK